MDQVKPPSEKEMWSYSKQHRQCIVWIGLFSFIPLMFGMFSFVLGHKEAILFIPFVILTFLYLLVSYLIGIFGKPWNYDNHVKTILKARQLTFDNGYPSVDVYLPVCNEDFEIILNAWDHTKELLWDGEINIHVLDDGDSDFLKSEAEKRGFNYIRRMNKAFKKAGNVLNAFLQTQGDLILILDADFCPRPDFIKVSAAYLIADNKVALVQTPQYFEVSGWMNWIEKGSGYVQELFYRLIQVSRNKFGGSICVGSCAIYRRSAMQSIGGPVQIEHSEDVWTGFNLIDNGWKVEYLPINLSKGRCPDNLRAYFNQQYRWCSGSMSLAFSKEFWKSRLNTMQKVCYFSGMLYYMSTAIGLFMIPLPGLFMMWFSPEHVFWYNVFLYLPSFLFGTVVTVLWSHYKSNWNYLYLRHISYYAHMFALADKARGTVQGWIATGEKGKVNNRYKWAERTGLAWTSIIFIATAAGVIRASDYLPWYNFLPSGIFCIFHSFIGLRSFTKNQELK